MVFGANKATISISTCASVAHSFVCVFICGCILVYACVFMRACVRMRALSPFLLYLFLWSKLLIIYCKKCLQHMCMCVYHVCVYIFVVYAYVCAVCARAHAIHTGWWWIPTLRAFFSTNERRGEKDWEESRDIVNQNTYILFTISCV